MWPVKYLRDDVICQEDEDITPDEDKSGKNLGCKCGLIRFCIHLNVSRVESETL